MLTPANRASCGPLGANGLPANAIDPESGRCAPLSTFINVLLPAPFSPISANTRPERTSSATSLSACVAPKRLEMRIMFSNGADMLRGSVLSKADAEITIDAKGTRVL